MDSEIPLQAIEKLFVEKGVIFISDEQIPAELRGKGWRSETVVVRESSGYEVSHLIFAPGRGGEPQCIFIQGMTVEVFPGTDAQGKATNQIKALQVCPGENSPALRELLAQIEAAQKTVEFEVRF